MIDNNKKHFLPFVIVTVLLGLGSWLFDIKKSWLLPTGATTFSSYPYYPFDKLFRALKDENIPVGKNIVSGLLAVSFFRNNGLALLVPKNEKNLIITKSAK